MGAHDARPNWGRLIVDDYADRQAKFRRDRQLAALIGETRTAVLRSLEVVCNTTELARRAGTSIASASTHTTVLRNAGLISTRRHGASVLHSLTPVGIALLAGHIEPDLSSGWAGHFDGIPTRRR